MINITKLFFSYVFNNLLLTFVIIIKIIILFYSKILLLYICIYIPVLRSLYIYIHTHISFQLYITQFYYFIQCKSFYSELYNKRNLYYFKKQKLLFNIFFHESCQWKALLNYFTFLNCLKFLNSFFLCK